MVNDDLEVVWNGTMDRQGAAPCLVPDRDSKPGELWEPPRRAYNKKSAYWTTPRSEWGLDKEKEAVKDGEDLVLHDGSGNENVEYFGGSDE